MKRAMVGYLSDIHSGTGKFCLTLQSILNEMGYEVVFLSAYQDDTLLDYEKKGIVKLLRIHSLKHPVRQYKDICRELNSKKYDLAYFNISEAFNCAGVIAAHKCGVEKIAVHSHSSGSDDSKAAVRAVKRTLHILSRDHIIAKNANIYNACSEKAGEWMFPKKVQQKINTIHNAVNLNVYQFDPEVRRAKRESLNLGEKKTVGFVGGFTYVKNIYFTLKTMQALHAKDSNTILLLAGSGPLFGDIEKYIEENDMGEYVKLLGQRSDIPDLMQAMDVLVLPSFFEGMPYVAIEAQASGLPVILSDTITREACVTDRCCYLPTDDPDVWADMIEKLVGSERKPGMLENTVYDLETEKKEIMEVLADES